MLIFYFVFPPPLILPSYERVFPVGGEYLTVEATFLEIRHTGMKRKDGKDILSLCFLNHPNVCVS